MGEREKRAAIKYLLPAPPVIPVTASNFYYQRYV